MTSHERPDLLTWRRIATCSLAAVVLMLVVSSQVSRDSSHAAPPFEANSERGPNSHQSFIPLRPTATGASSQPTTIVGSRREEPQKVIDGRGSRTAPSIEWQLGLRKERPSQCHTTSTRGAFDDEWKSGNVEDVEAIGWLDGNRDRQSMVKNHHPSRSQDHQEEEFVTSLERVGHNKTSKDCYYRVTNFCVDRGALLFFLPQHRKSSGASDDKKNNELLNDDGKATSGTLRLCNELRSKFNLRYSIQRSKKMKPVVVTDTFAHVTACWQLYGYHLVECLAAVYAGQDRNIRFLTEGMNTTATNSPLPLQDHDPYMYIFNHGSSMPKLAREHYSHATYMGSFKDFNSAKNEREGERGYRKAAFWGLWRGLTGSAERMGEVRKFSFLKEGGDNHPLRCFKRGLVGQPQPMGSATPAERLRHNAKLRRAWDVAAMPLGGGQRPAGGEDAISKRDRLRSGCKALNIVVAQRSRKTSRVQGTREIINLDKVLHGLRHDLPAAEATPDPLLHSVGGSSDSGLNVFVVDWAALSLVEQMKTASSTDILITMHGAGNSWVALMPPRSVLVEIWPDCVARGVYVGMSVAYNVRYYPLCHGKKPAAGAPSDYFMHTSVEVDVQKLVALVKEKAIPYLKRAHCC